MQNKRVELRVSANLDPVPGTFHEPEDWERMLGKLLMDVVPHYEPVVEVQNRTTALRKVWGAVKVEHDATIRQCDTLQRGRVDFSSDWQYAQGLYFALTLLASELGYK